MVSLSHDAWTVIGVAVAEGAAMVTAIVVAHIKTKGRIQETEDKVEQVRILAEPTGNGYASETLRRLECIGKDVRDLRSEVREDRAILMTHLRDHTRE